jgi:hypothetical protein
MKFSVTFFWAVFFLIKSSIVYPQTSEIKKDTFYILMSKKMDRGYWRIDTKQVRDTNAVAYVFGGFSPLPYDEQAFSLDIKKKRQVEKKLSTKTMRLTPLQVMDSLKKYGRSFFRENVFFAVFKKDDTFYVHPCKGEYIHMDYSDE